MRKTFSFLPQLNHILHNDSNKWKSFKKFSKIYRWCLSTRSSKSLSNCLEPFMHFLITGSRKIYVHKITMFKICELCYLQILIPFRFNYNLENYWHSIVKNEVINTKCQFCETELVKWFQPAYNCWDCIEHSSAHKLLDSLYKDYLFSE